MEKLTIHRALSELKLIGAKIKKGIEDINPSGITQKDKLVNQIYQREEFEKTAKEKFQSVVDLIARRSKIKSAIVKANGVTEVKIAERVMTIADAINLKAAIVFEKELIDSLKRKHNQSKANLSKNNEVIDTNALNLAQVALGKQGIKIGDNDAQSVIEPYLKANKFELVDPIGVEKQIEALEKKIGDFEAEVDAVLSEINAITLIEI